MATPRCCDAQGLDCSKGVVVVGGQSLPHEYSLPVNHLVNWEQVHSSHRKIKQIQNHVSLRTMFFPAAEAAQGHEEQELVPEQMMR